MSKSQFQRYAKYYDLIYQTKPYPREARLVETILKKHSKRKIKTILSLGVGTGGHELLLAKKDYRITGIDLSKPMLKIAREKAREQSLKADFRYGDVRKFKTTKKFDAVIAMFNIAGYQNTNDDFAGFVNTAARHLKKSGLFLFDCWHLPAVISDPPQNRIKKIKLGRNYKLIRETRQRLDLLNNILHIEFTLKEYQGKKLINSFKEKHPMRFFTLPEIKHYFSDVGLELKTRTIKNWDMLIVGRKR